MVSRENMATQMHHRDGAAMSAGAEDGEDAQQHQQQQLWLDNFMRMLLHDVEMQGNIFKPTSDQARIALFYNQLDDADKEWLEQRYGRPCPALRSSTGQPYRRKGPTSTQVAQPSFPNIYRIIADYIDHISSDDTCAPRSTGSVSSSQHHDHLNTATPASLASSAGVTRSLSPLIPPPPFGAERPLTSVRCTAPPPPPPPPESIASGACNLLQAVHAQLDQRSQALQGIVVQLVADHQLSDSQKLERLDLLCSQYQLCISAAALDANRHTPLPRGLHQAQAELVRRLGGFSLPTTTFALGDKSIPPQAQTQTQSPSLQRPSSNHGGRVSLQEEHVRNPSDAQASEVEAMRRQQHRATHALASLRATLFPTNASGRASPCASGSTSWHGIATNIGVKSWFSNAAVAFEKKKIDFRTRSTFLETFFRFPYYDDLIRELFLNVSLLPNAFVRDVFDTSQEPAVVRNRVSAETLFQRLDQPMHLDTPELLLETFLRCAHQSDPIRHASSLPTTITTTPSAYFNQHFYGPSLSLLQGHITVHNGFFPTTGHHATSAEPIHSNKDKAEEDPESELPAVDWRKSGVSVDDDEVDGVGDEIGDVDDNEVDGVGDKVGGINTSVQCVDLMLEVIPGPQWTTAFGSILIRTANLLWVPSDVR
ncbi:hypothetical protein NDA10_001632 [Ustilago hordei]|nr:hypothetical protein NDA10_001632 [Ustilago hordei]